MNDIPTATLLVGYTYRDEQERQAFDELAHCLSRQLDQPVIACSLDQLGQPLVDGIMHAVQLGAVRIVTVPLFLSPAEYQNNAVAKAITLASRRWPFLQFHVSPPLDWSAWLRVVGTVAVEAIAAHTPLANREEVSVILTGRGAADPDVNSDVAKLARLLYEAYAFGWVDVAFLSNTRPSVSQLITRSQTLGAKEIVVVPYLLFPGEPFQTLTPIVNHQDSASQESGESLHIDCVLTFPFSSHPTFIDVLLACHETALEDRSLLPISWEELERQLTAELNTHDKGFPGQRADDEDAFQQLSQKIDAILPPRYQGRTDDVSAAPMTAADLVFDDDGQVAWNQVFGVDDPDNPFCELALAGGPSHRGTLLEAVPAEQCCAEPGKYAAAVAEIKRGISMITGLPVFVSETPGWIGVQCEDEEMAIWLVRAIIVENVMVRREDDVIYLPVGPHFTLTNEVKSIVTVTAKTHHYWNEHVAALEMK